VAIYKIRFFSDIHFEFNSEPSLSLQSYIKARTLRNHKKQ
jgi:hypothetical protein